MKEEIKVVELKRLEIRNFKGIKSQVIDFSKKTNIYGANASGKSTIFDAFTWLSTGKSSDEVADFPIKRLDENGQVIEKLDVSVSAEFSVYIQNQITGERQELPDLSIRREFVENWGAERRGSSNIVLKGNVNKYYWNGAPVDTETEFKKRIDEVICDPETFKIVTNPLYFSSDSPSMTWKRRREILLGIVGEISDDEILDREASLSDIIYEMKHKSISDILSEVNASKKKIKDEISAIGTRIDEADGLKKEPVSEEEIKKEKEPIIVALSDISSKIESEFEKQKQENEALLSLQKEQYEVEAEILKIQNDHKSEFEKESSSSGLENIKKECREKVERLEAGKKYIQSLDDRADKDKKTEKESHDRAIKGMLSIITENKTYVIDAISQQDKLREEFKKVNAEIFVLDDQATHCTDPLCGKKYEDHIMSEKKEELIQNFNKAKRSSIDIINSQGIALKTKIEGLKLEIEQLTEAIQVRETDFKKTIKAIDDNHKESVSKYSKIIKELEADILEISDKVSSLESGSSNIESLENRVANCEVLSGLKKRLDEIKSSIENRPEISNSALTFERNKLEAKIREIDAKLSVNEENKRIDDRINELKEKSKSLGEALSLLDKKGFDIEKYEAIKYTDLQDRVNTAFAPTKVKMFNKLQNGGYEPTCVVTSGGVPFVKSGLNTADRYQTGVRIIEIMNQHFGVKLPVFLDNRESVTDLPNTSLQIVSLFVSGDDKKLRIENE